MTEPDAATPDGVTSQEVAPSSHVRRRRWPLVVLIGLTVLVLLRGLVVETFTVPTGSMEPTLQGGDRIVVWKPSHDEVRRGDVIVFDGTSAFGRESEAPDSSGPAAVVRSIGSSLGIRQGEADYVKRVIGVGGDRVSMDRAGVVTVNGARLQERYARIEGVFTPFDIEVPAGRVWVMGDHRAASDDSRNHLGDPGGGSVAERDIIGQVVWRYWPHDRVGTLSAPATMDEGAQ